MLAKSSQLLWFQNILIVIMFSISLYGVKICTLFYLCHIWKDVIFIPLDYLHNRGKLGVNLTWKEVVKEEIMSNQILTTAYIICILIIKEINVSTWAKNCTDSKTYFKCQNRRNYLYSFYEFKLLRESLNILRLEPKVSYNFKTYKVLMINKKIEKFGTD